MTLEVTVTDMSCGGCEQAVENSIAELGNVEDVQADHEQGIVTVEGAVDAEQIRQQITAAGYDPE